VVTPSRAPWKPRDSGQSWSNRWSSFARSKAKEKEHWLAFSKPLTSPPDRSPEKRAQDPD